MPLRDTCASAAGLANHERACTRELRPSGDNGGGDDDDEDEAEDDEGSGPAADGEGADAGVLLVDDDDVLAVAKHRLSGLQSEDARKRAEFYLKIRSSLDAEVDPLDPEADKKYVENIAKARDRSNVRHSASSHAALEKAVSDVTKARAIVDSRVCAATRTCEHGQATQTPGRARRIGRGVCVIVSCLRRKFTVGKQ